MSPPRHTSDTEVFEKEKRKRWNGWLAKGVSISVIAVGLPTLGVYGGHILDIWNAPKAIDADKVQINAVQSEIQDTQKWREGVTYQLKALQENQAEERASLHRIENQLSWEYGRPPMATLNTNRNP